MKSPKVLLLRGYYRTLKLVSSEPRALLPLLSSYLEAFEYELYEPTLTVGVAAAAPYDGRVTPGLPRL